jgi:hypothetical protein
LHKAYLCARVVRFSSRPSFLKRQMYFSYVSCELLKYPWNPRVDYKNFGFKPRYKFYFSRALSQMDNTLNGFGLIGPISDPGPLNGSPDTMS